MTQTIHYETTKHIADQSLRNLYISIGWTSYTEQLTDLNVLLQGSRLVISAWCDKQLVGLIRTIGDGVSIEYVQDLLVLPEFQNRGIGSILLEKVKKETSHIRQFVLITDNSPENQTTVEWYEQHGLIPVSDANIVALWRK